MDLRQLRYFVTLAEAGNFNRAAERLNMSQPPLTVAIRKLETDLGAALFDRGARGVTLTVAGRAALDPARAVLAQADQIRDIVRDGVQGERGRLRVGYVGSATFELLPRIIPAFGRRYPRVELALEESTSVDIARRLAGDELDVGLIRLPLLETAPLETHVVDQDEFHAAVLTSSRFGHLDHLPLQALADETFVLQGRVSVLHAITLMACHAAGFAPRVAQRATQLSAVLSLVRSGLGVALVPARAANAIPQGVKLIRLDNPVSIETGVAVPRLRASPLAQNFVAIARETYSETISNTG